MKLKSISIFLVLIIIPLLAEATNAQNMIARSQLRSEFALKENRIKYKEELDGKIDVIFNSELSSDTEADWQSLFREIGLVYYKNDKIHNAIKKGISFTPSASLSFVKSLVETIIILYPTEYSDFVRNLWNNTNDPTLFAYCSHHLLNCCDLSSEIVSEELLTRFPNWENIPQFKFMKYYLVNPNTKTPDLSELLSHDFMNGKTIIYSLHRKDRTFSGITIIKKPDGSFVKNENDSIFYVKQLAKSVSGLPGYLSQGDTPQGIFSIVGFYVSPTESIGPTANVLTRIPFEVSTQLFYHGRVDKKNFIKSDYKDLLPENWKNYFPMYESFYAGKTGRRKIVMHGSVDDLSFYEGQAYYPLTPSKGCLTTKEIWSEVDGRNIESEQSKLMNAFFSTGNIKGFLVVVNIDDKEEDIKIEDILPYIN